MPTNKTRYDDFDRLVMLDKRGAKVSATIYTQKVKQQLSLDLEKHWYAPRAC